eukprot:CAMPEP_0204299086 /NCGR_PEP_ID=MMETSP0468-20130131/76146_1 /ASSEMBLY_ACC=CAM_ASM_000383 /TAXON_ID=2969 /ORGANISM="Oxyrrhis marina" /LENGTH=42 /DNA_ID= /DNA_START= /DNA_END= /DNA_ORIENTATION=
MISQVTRDLDGASSPSSCLTLALLVSLYPANVTPNPASKIMS